MKILSWSVLLSFFLLFIVLSNNFIASESTEKIPEKYLDAEEEDDDPDSFDNDDLDDEIDNDDNAEEDDFLDGRTLDIINLDEDKMPTTSKPKKN